MLTHDGEQIFLGGPNEQDRGENWANAISSAHQAFSDLPVDHCIRSCPIHPCFDIATNRKAASRNGGAPPTPGAHSKISNFCDLLQHLADRGALAGVLYAG
jgi:hypothetical protein